MLSEVFLGKFGHVRNEYLRNYLCKVINKNAVFAS